MTGWQQEYRDLAEDLERDADREVREMANDKEYMAATKAETTLSGRAAKAIRDLLETASALSDTLETDMPAFPCTNEQFGSAGASSGMTLRDWFAGQALAGLIRNRDALHVLNGAPDFPVKANVAEAAYSIADAMLAARAKDAGHGK